MRLQPRLVCIFLVVVVASFSVAIGQRPSTFTLRQRIIASDPGVPAVLVTVDQRRVPLGTIVTFMLTPAKVVRDPHYTVTLNFGDGKQRSVRATEIPHLYEAVGTYLYSVRVKANNYPPPVALNATPATVKSDQQVNFFAQTSWAYPNLQYRFSYGDGTSSDWQDSPQANHVYRSAGKYSAYVDIGDKSGPFGGSPRKEIEVNGSSILDPKPTPSPGPKSTPSPASKPTPSPGGGSGNGGNNDAGNDNRGNDNRGNNNAGNNNGANNSVGNSNAGNDNGGGNSSIGAFSSPSPNGTENPDWLGFSGNWWKYLLIAALIVFLIYQATGLLAVARPTFAAFSDPGVSDVAGKEHVVPIDFQMVLNRNVAAGDYAVESSESNLVKNADKLGERQILEI